MSNNWIEIDAAALVANFRTLQSAAGDATEILPVIKSNAYGHGAEVCAVPLVRAGARWLGVTSASEGARVRRTLAAAGLAAEILVMCGPLPDDVAILHQYSLIPTIWTSEHVDWLRDNPLRVHVEVDSGMGRQGVLPGYDLAALLEKMRAAGIALDGIFTHFASTEEANSALTQRQQRLFEIAVDYLRQSGLRPVWVHAGNSSSLDNPAQETPWLADLAAIVGARAMVRPGIALYGYCLPIRGVSRPEGRGAPRVRPALKLVMTWKANVLSVSDLAPGETIGYNATFTVRAPTRIALLPVGYADGLRRDLSGTNDCPGGWVMLHGRRAPILGRVSMNLTVVDISLIPKVQPGDQAIVLGEGVTADDHARLANTISYEILCGIHPTG
jgi:alanine racemase